MEKWCDDMINKLNDVTESLNEKMVDDYYNAWKKTKEGKEKLRQKKFERILNV